MRKTASTTSYLQQRPAPPPTQHQRNSNSRFWYGSSPNLYNNETSSQQPSPSVVNRDSLSPPYYYHSSTSSDTHPPSRFQKNGPTTTTTTTTTTLKSGREPLMRPNNTSTACSNGFSRRHTATTASEFGRVTAADEYDALMMCPPSYNVEHLASFAVGSQFSVTTPTDGVRKLKQMEQNSAICPVPMVFSLFPNRVSVSEENGNIVEEFPLELVSDPTAHSSSDIRDLFNNMLLFIVLEHTISNGLSVPTELHIFQCTNVSASEVAEDLYNYIRGHYRKVIKRTTAANISHQNHSSAHEMPRGHFTRDFAPNTEYFEMDVNTLNRCFDDIERFVARVQSVALAQRELEMQKNRIMQQSKGKKAKEAAKAAQNGILQLRAQIPSADEFAEIFQKFKLCFNLLAKLKNHIHEPSSPELIHFLFTPLTVLLDACHWGLGQQIAQQVQSPLLSLEACELLQSYLYPKEMECWRALGRNWNTPPEDWLGTLPSPYRPVFGDGWAPYGHPQGILELHDNIPQPIGQRQIRYGSVPPAPSMHPHRAASVPAQPHQSRFYFEPARTVVENGPNARDRLVENLEMERINLEKERLDLERRKVLERERQLLEQERRIREEAEKLERERRQLQESEKHSIAGSEPLPDFYRGNSLQASPVLNRRAGSMQVLASTHSPAAAMSARQQQMSPAFNQSPRQKAFFVELARRGCKIVQVTYDRIAQNPKELTVVRGELLEVLNDAKNWWECRNINNRAGYVPHTILTVLDGNEWDEVSKLDDLLPEVSSQQKMRSPTGAAHDGPPFCSGTSTPEAVRERRGRNGEFRYF